MDYEAEALRICTDTPPELKAWLKEQGLTPDDADLSLEWQYGALASPLRAKGVLEVMEAWRREQIKRLSELGVTNYQKVANKICYRFAKAKSVQWKPVRRSKRRDAELSELPPDLRWVYEHPALDLDLDSEGEEFRVAVETYERKKPAPGQGAVNYLANCKNDSKIRAKMFDDVRTFMLEAKRRKWKEAPSQVQVEGREQVANMKDMLSKMGAK